jgi:hypothetical protein
MLATTAELLNTTDYGGTLATKTQKPLTSKQQTNISLLGYMTHHSSHYI